MHASGNTSRNSQRRCTNEQHRELETKISMSPGLQFVGLWRRNKTNDPETVASYSYGINSAKRQERGEIHTCSSLKKPFESPTYSSNNAYTWLVISLAASLRNLFDVAIIRARSATGICLRIRQRTPIGNLNSAKWIIYIHYVRDTHLSTLDAMFNGWWLRKTGEMVYGTGE